MFTSQQGNDNGNSNGDGDAARALEIAGYPTLLQEYLWQQQQQQQQDRAAAAASAATMESRFALANQHQFGFAGGNVAMLAGAQGMNPFGASAFGELDGMNQLQHTQMDPSQLLFERLQAANALSQGGARAAAAAGLPSGLWAGTGLQSGGKRPADQFAENGILGPWSERSAGLLGSMVATGPVSKPAKVKKGRRKQPKDKPKRPLSAYNIFFKEERARLLQKLDDAKNEKGDDEEEEDKKTPSKIGFENLAKIIGSKWQDLTPSQVEYYKEKAGEDMKRYKSEMETYLAKQSGREEAQEDAEESAEPEAKKQKVWVTKALVLL